MQFIRTYNVLCFLCNFPILRRQQLRAYRCVQYIIEHLCQFLLSAGVCIITYQMAYQSLWHRTVYRIHGHMISIVGCPSQCQLWHISGSYYKSTLFICHIHQYLCPFPCLRIFIGYIMVIFILSDISKMNLYRIYDGNLHKFRSQTANQIDRIVIGPVCGSESRHGNRCNLFSWNSQ